MEPERPPRQNTRVHWLQHAEHEGLGCIGPWLQQKQYAVTCTRLFAGDPLPRSDDFDWLMVMGGPMNVDQHALHPWLLLEKQLISDACVTNKKMLGICLGSQLLAQALKAEVRKNQYSEIGFFQVNLDDKASNSIFFETFPERFIAFHWHGDTFSIPDGCSNLIKSDACVNQAFVWGDRAVAVQFHLEVTAADARRWLALENLTPERYVQSAREILADPARFAANNALMVRLLERMDAIRSPDSASGGVVLGAGVSSCGEIAGSRQAKR